MKLYRKLIKPVLYYPGQSYEPKKKNLEDPAVWYPEEEYGALLERFKNLNNTFNTVGFDEQYIEYKEEHIKLDSPEKCSDCKSMYTIGLCYYCHMKSISPDNSGQDISTTYVDPDSKPDWCPIDKTNAALEEMPPEKREKADMIMKGLSAFFGSGRMLSGEKEEE